MQVRVTVRVRVQAWWCQSPRPWLTVMTPVAAVVAVRELAHPLALWPLGAVADTLAMARPQQQSRPEARARAAVVVVVVRVLADTAVPPRHSCTR